MNVTSLTPMYYSASKETTKSSGVASNYQTTHQYNELKSFDRVNLSAKSLISPDGQQNRSLEFRVDQAPRTPDYPAPQPLRSLEFGVDQLPGNIENKQDNLAAKLPISLDDQVVMSPEFKVDENQGNLRVNDDDLAAKLPVFPDDQIFKSLEFRVDENLETPDLPDGPLVILPVPGDEDVSAPSDPGEATEVPGVINQLKSVGDLEGPAGQNVDPGNSSLVKTAEDLINHARFDHGLKEKLFAFLYKN